MNTLGWSYGRLRARLVLLVVVLGLVMGLHVVAPSRAHAMDNDGTCGGEVCVTDDGSGGVGGGSGYGDTGGTGGDWGDTGGGGYTGGDSGNGWGDPSDTGGDPGNGWGDPSDTGDTGDTGGDPGNGWGDPSDTGDTGDQGPSGNPAPSSTSTDPFQPWEDGPIVEPPAETPPPPQEEHIDNGPGAPDGSDFDPLHPCQAQLEALIKARGDEALDAADRKLVECMAEHRSDPHITARVAPPAPGLTGPVATAAQQTAQARVQLHAAKVAAHTATLAAMKAAAKAEQQAGRASARRAPAKPKAAGKRHVKRRRG
jgi:hypothetical protein